MSSQGPWLFDAISWILSLKNKCFVFLIVYLNAFQFFNCLNILYFTSLVWQLSFYYALKCLVILIHFEYLNQITSDLFANSWTVSSSKTLLLSCSVLIFLIASIRMNLSSSLFLIIICHLSGTNSLIMEMLTVNRV